jgi:hypothetical protein
VFGQELLGLTGLVVVLLCAGIPRRRIALLKRLLFAGIVLGSLAIATDLALRPFAPRWVYYRPTEMFLDVYPEVPLLVRLRRGSRFEGETYGDLAALSGQVDARETRHVVFSVDEHGFRNPPEGGPYDVLVLGDSFCLGTGSSDEDIWPRKLAAGTGLRTYNLSLIGSPWQGYATLSLELERLELRPGAVLVWGLFLGNDLEDLYGPVDLAQLERNGLFGRLAVSWRTWRRRSPLRLRSQQGIRGTQLAFVEQRVSGGRIRLEPVQRKTLDGRPVLFFSPYALKARESSAGLRRHRNWTRLRDTVGALRRLAAQHGLRVLLVNVPSKSEVYGWLQRGGAPWSTAASGTSGAGEVVGELAREHGLELLDLGPPLIAASESEHRRTGRLLYWRDDSHWNPVGHARVAELVAEALGKGN